MKLSYEGIGQWAATFACTEVSEGEMVKISGNGTVAACSDGGDACTVALGGLVTAGYTGSAPTLGWCGLSADASGGVKSNAGGRSCLVVDVDTASETVTFAL